MNKLDRLIRKVNKARAKDLRTTPVRLSTFHRHYKTTKTRAEKTNQDIERINRNAPVTRYFVNEKGEKV